MSELENNLIEKVKILILYGDGPVDGENKDGKVERIFRDEDDTAHYFYMKEFLESHLKNEVDLQKSINEKHDVNTVFFEMQKLGNIVFAENTSHPKYKSGVFYVPKNITKNQKQTLIKLQKQLEKENYNILAFLNLHRDKDGILTGNQKQGTPKILDEFTNEKEETVR